MIARSGLRASICWVIELQVSLCEQKQIVGDGPLSGKPQGAALDLTLGFLSRHIQDPPLRRHLNGGLQKEG